MTTAEEIVDAMNAVLNGYIEYALFSSTDDSDEPLDSVYSADDLAPATLSDFRADCESFIDYCAALGIDRQEWSDWQFGGDFWLSRNGHGAGFFDRGRDSGDALQAAAKTFGEVWLYVGDDGLIYSTR